MPERSRESLVSGTFLLPTGCMGHIAVLLHRCSPYVHQGTPLKHWALNVHDAPICTSLSDLLHISQRPPTEQLTGIRHNTTTNTVQKRNRSSRQTHEQQTRNEVQVHALVRCADRGAGDGLPDAALHTVAPTRTMTAESAPAQTSHPFVSVCATVTFFLNNKI
jgi:hypothetical protein